MTFRHTLVSAAVLLATSGLAEAARFPIVDARSAGMGGIGVTTATLGSAQFSNPAMLAMQRKNEDVGLLLPAGVNVADPGNLVKDLEDFQDAYDRFNAAPPASPGQIAAINDANAALASMTGKTVSANASAAFGAGFAGERWAWAVGLLGIGDAGFAPISNDGNPLTLNPATGTVNGSVYSAAIVKSELGVSVARGFDVAGGKLALAVTPKRIGARTYDYTQPIDGDINFDTDKGETDHGSTSNLDVGAAYGLGGNILVGVVGRNLRSNDYTTLTGIVIKSEPQWRGGLSYNSRLFTVGVDYDLKKNKPVFLEPESRMLSAGVEFNAFDWLQLRAGYLTNTVSGDNFKQFTAGLGVAIAGTFHLDVSALVNPSNTEAGVGVYAQMGLKF